VASGPDGRLHRPGWDEPLDRWPRLLGLVSSIGGTAAWQYRRDELDASAKRPLDHLEEVRGD
jgi:hypothetical protein